VSTSIKPCKTILKVYLLGSGGVYGVALTPPAPTTPVRIQPVPQAE